MLVRPFTADTVLLFFFRYLCVCQAGFTGNRCDLNIDECQEGQLQCLNGGTCIDTVGSYHCVCPDNISGKDLADWFIYFLNIILNNNCRNY